jgi:hypothetical protein
MDCRQSISATAARPQPRPIGASCALGLAAELLGEGLVPGTPPHLSAQAQSIDRQLCRQLRCPACKRRGLSYQPFHGAGRYVVLAVCRCGAAEEV